MRHITGNDEIDDLLTHLTQEYHATAATATDNSSSRLVDYRNAPTFYDFLLAHGFTRFSLSAYGIGRDIEA